LDTAKAARAVFGRSNFYLTTGDQANQLFDGLIYEDPTRWFQKSSRIMGMLYLITIFQFVETLPDHLAADALRKRIDWKYALHLPLTYPGLEAASFCKFRRWLLAERNGQQNLQTLLSRLSDVMDLTGKQYVSLQSSQVINVVCQFSRLAKIWEAFSQAMEALATKRPDWLLAASLPHWYQRYSYQHKDLNLRADDPERQILAQAIGADGIHLLEAISKAGDPQLADLDEILALREVWHEQFDLVDGNTAWRKNVCAGCLLPAKLVFRS